MASLRTKLGIFAFSVFAIIAFLGWAVSSGNNEGEAMRMLATQYSSQVAQGSYDGAYSLQTTDLQKNLTKEFFSKVTTPVKAGTDFTITTVSLADQTVEGTIKDSKGSSHTLAYQLVQEGDIFKIADFKVDEPLKKPEPVTTATTPVSVVKEVIISDQEVEFLQSYPVPMFTKETPEIHIGVLTSREPDITVSIALIYLKTGEKLGPVTGTPSGFYYSLGRGSFSGTKLVFKKPTAGWLPGDYKFVATSSKGDSKELAFQIK